MYEIILKIFSSIIIILLVSYFSPFLGVCLIIIRLLVNKNKKNYYLTPISLIVFGLLILIPKFIEQILNYIEIKNIDISYLDIILNSDIYPKLIIYSKFLVITGFIFLIIASIFKKIFERLRKYLKTYIFARENLDAERRQKNDMEIKRKQEQAKKYKVIRCKYCGADNTVIEELTTCKFCRRKIKSE